MADLPLPPFPELLRRHRRDQGYTQEALAERAGLSARGIRSLEHGERHAPHADTIQLLADALQLAPHDRSTFVASAARQRRARTAPTPRDQPPPTGGFLGARPSGPLVARHTEIRHALRLVDDVAEGEGRFLLLAGEPGVGKTRLAQDVSVHARDRGFLVASGRCYEPEERLPYYPFREALSMLYEVAPPGIRADVPRSWPYLLQLLPDQSPPRLPSGHSAEEEQQQLFYAVTSFIAAVSAAQPVALLLDDLHWADASSLKLLQFIARHTRTRPVFLLGTYRDVEVGRQHPLEGALRDLNREGLTEEIAVRRFDQQGTTALTAAIFDQTDVSAEFAELLYHHTEGNPFFTHEVLKALIERGDIYQENGRWERREIEEIDIPKSIRSAVGERVARLPADAQETLAEASVLGQTFTFDDLQAVSGRAEQALDEALEAAGAAGLIRPDGRDTYAFNHVLTQQVLYDELSPRRRRRLHLAAGEALERGRHPQLRVTELAWHFLQGDDPEKALRYAVQAGDEAGTGFAQHEAARHYRTAVELARELGDQRVEMEVFAKLGTALGTLGVLDEAVHCLKAADCLAIQLGDREVQRQAVAEAIGMLHDQNLTDEALFRRFGELLQDDEPTPGLVALHAVDSRIAFVEGRFAESRDRAARMAEIARAIGSDALLVEAELQRGRALIFLSPRLTDRGDAITVLEQAVVLAEQSRNLPTLCWLLNTLASCHMDQGELEEQLHYGQRALQQAQQYKNAVDQMWSSAMVAEAHDFLGQLTEARHHAEAAVRTARLLDPVRPAAYAYHTLAHLELLVGEWDEAAALVEEGMCLAHKHGELPQGLSWGRRIGGELALLRGEPRGVVDAFERAEASVLLYYEWPVAAEAYFAIGDDEAASGIVDDMMSFGGIVLSPALRLHGMIAARRGDWAEAETDLLRVLEVARTQKYRLEEGRALHELGILHAACGNRTSAREHLHCALHLFLDMGARAYAARTQAVLNTPTR